MAGDLVLLTGGTGHIGFAVLKEALRSGYKVRASVRRESSIAELQSQKSIEPYQDSLSFVIVPDITVPGAFDEALKDVVHVLHVASPLAQDTEDYERYVIQPAINGTISILNSALKVPSIKRVVITSSLAAVRPDPLGPDTVVTAENLIPDPKGPYTNGYAAYVASKVKSYNASLRWLSTNQPHFQVTNVLPCFVIGKNELATTPKASVAGSNKILMDVVLGKVSPLPLSGCAVHIDDVAYVHVKALDPSVPGNEKFGCSSDPTGSIVWDNANEIVKRRFPDAVEKGYLPANGSLVTKKVRFDASRTEEVLGFKWKGWEEQIVSQVAWYLEILSRERET